MRPSYKKKKRAALHEADPRCYYCKRVTVLRERSGKDSPIPEEATIEHLVDRYDPTRRYPKPQERRWVLACWKCNNDRSVARTKAQDIDFLRAKAFHWQADLLREAVRLHNW